MTDKEFFKKIANGKDDFLQEFVDILKKGKLPFCVIGGLGVNAYAEPVVSLDLDVVIVSEKIDDLLPRLKKKFRLEEFVPTPKRPHLKMGDGRRFGRDSALWGFINSINVAGKGSALRIQIQTDSRYQDFIQRAKVKNVLGYKLPVATVEDIFQGKVWAAMDETRRASKRQKDLADILRLIEVKPELGKSLPEKLKNQLI